MKIIDKIQKESNGTPQFSFEFFPPKTRDAVENLYGRMERLCALGPTFVDVTFSSITKDVTLEIAAYAQQNFGVEVLLHLSCAGMTVEAIKDALHAAKQAGIQNILALRGDPVKGATLWEKTLGGVDSAADLVRLIRKEHGNYFGIAVAGFPEGHPYSNGGIDKDIEHLKEKVDLGADFILTQFFYDTKAFLSYVAKCRAAGITCPILPGFLPLQNYSSFSRLVTFCKCAVPSEVLEALEAIKTNDAEIKALGIQLTVSMCEELMRDGINFFHFYTLNLERSVSSILTKLGVQEMAVLKKGLPWKGSRSNLAGDAEAVRPIHWANRYKSYIQRTTTWDEFPNGRWGDNRSPAFGELSDIHVFRSVGSPEARRAMWGETLLSFQDVYHVFQQYVEGKIPMLPWCEEPLQGETASIVRQLARLNAAGVLTINSQPAVNGESSLHPTFGWGGPGGRVYQKAYVEFFVRPELLTSLMLILKDFPELSMHALNSAGDYQCNSVKSVTALTWGAFPNKEILQPTVFDPLSFVAWSQECFALWTRAWAALYDDATETSGLLHKICDTFYLVALIDNDYVAPTIFSALDKLISRPAVD